VSYIDPNMEPLTWKIESTIDRFFRNREKRLDIVGTSSVSVLAALLSHEKPRWSERPHLVIVSTLDEAHRLQAALDFFGRTPAQILPPFDIGLYSGLYPNRRCGR
jgi:hypothetical protein